MIPLRLKISGFLSYRDPVDLDLGSFSLACVSGSNGAGKSSLLDAITWVLFGQARKRDESLINLQSKTAEVEFTFAYEDNTYRVMRTLGRGKTTLLEFQIRQEGGEWKPLTEHTMRETQQRIEHVLRLDHDTFVNAAFFLQGKADQFAQQSPARRKEILSNILGLEVWDVYRERAADRRKTIETEQRLLAARLQEIDGELAEEPERLRKLQELEKSLEQMITLRQAKETILGNIRGVRAALEEQKQQALRMGQALERRQTSLDGMRSRCTDKEQEKEHHTVLVARAGSVEQAYAAWQSSRVELDRLDEMFRKFHDHDEKRQALLQEIGTERARLEQERQALKGQETAIQEQALGMETLLAELRSAQQGLEDVEKRLAQGSVLQKQIQEEREKQAELRTENTRLKSDMDLLKERINKLEAADGAYCPLCGQTLNREHLAATLDQLKAEGKVLGDKWRMNKGLLEELSGHITDSEQTLADLTTAEYERMSGTALVSQLKERLENLQQQAAEWNGTGAKRLNVVEKLLAGEKYAAAAQKKLARLDEELAALGYDAAAHGAARQAENQARQAELEMRQLEAARAALKPLDDEITSLRTQIEELQQEVDTQQQEFNDLAALLAKAEAETPDADLAERELLQAQEQENRTSQEVGAARQKVNVLDEQRKRARKMTAEREQLGVQIGQYRSLERTFGKDGVPALLIEQALPEIETKANEILDRLSDGTMSVKFVTQSTYKDKKRDDLKETLDIQISDGAGTRDYELFSGGEAFRVNFAIRLALSEVLAKRKGARLQTLVIDEGFGSQDAQGKQRLIEAINAVRNDFARILVITHLDELKDAFPTRIEVEKTTSGSTARII